MKYLICILSIICISIGLSYSQEKTSTDTSGTFIDNRDGHVYKWVKIGTQIWMAENLIYDAGSGSWNYFNDPAYATYGRLYDWETAKKACPAGWHLPDDSEWTILTDYVAGSKNARKGVVGGNKAAGGKMKIDDTTFWKSPNKGATNASGFSALPGGLFDIRRGFFFQTRTGAYFWSSAEYLDDSNMAWFRYLDYKQDSIYRDRSYKFFGLSVRCVRD